MCNDDKRAELKAFHAHPAWGRFVDRMSDEKIEAKLNQLRKAREWRNSSAKNSNSKEW